MTGLTAAQQELVDAKAEIAEMQGLIDGLEEKVRDGEAAEEAQQLGEQYGLQRLAVLRREAAERKLEKAEAAELSRRRGEAEKTARVELTEVSTGVIAEKYAAAMAALDDLADVCVRREDAVRRHLAVFADLDMPHVIANANPQHIFALDGERYERGTHTAQHLVSRATSHVFRVHGLRGGPSDFGGLHPVEEVITAASGMTTAEAKAANASGSLPARLVASAHVTAVNGEGL
ncbi:hypothetical protein ACIBCU_26310 [Streptomyces sp. NPDC051064]|uniref:hypothetical protein n=1 Tax=Streptomyces sp. NPDC051064 TaxID=3365641 RepID=UPI00379B11FF